MGYFHKGHLALMRLARMKTQRVVVSIFVNPLQFGPQEDLARYPRNPERDARLAKREDVHCLFQPSVEEIYSGDFQTSVYVEGLSQGLCGELRPGHFKGVATVVAKLFNIIQPDMAIFGAKDFQQLQVIRRMVKDLNYPVEILAHPIVREEDGLAMSSRNTYLDAEERVAARCLSRALDLARDLVSKGCLSGPEIIRAVQGEILSQRKTRVDYIFLGDPENLKPCEEVSGETLLALAVWVEKTRLIDNTILRRQSLHGDQ